MLARQASKRKNTIVKDASLSINGSREMKFVPFDAGKDGGHDGAGEVKVSSIFLTQSNFSMPPDHLIRLLALLKHKYDIFENVMKTSRKHQYNLLVSP